MTGESLLEKVSQTSAAVARPRSGQAVAETPELKKRRRLPSKQEGRKMFIRDALFAHSRKGAASTEKKRQRLAELAEKRRGDVAE